ncbi:MAG: hypothetical protein WAK96_01045, partial [Desulfobaccales bacterium]
MHLKAVERILVIWGGALGDVLITTPMVRTLKRAYPRSHLTYIIKARVKDMLVNNPDIDELLLYDGGILSRVARRPKYDLAINLDGRGMTNAICLLSGAKYRVGLPHFQNIRISHLNVYNVFPQFSGKVGDIIDHYLGIARALGLKDAIRETTLVLTPEEQDFADSFWEDCGLTQAARVVGLHPGGRTTARLWAVKDYAQVGDELMADSGCRILVFQGPGEEETAKS